MKSKIEIVKNWICENKYYIIFGIIIYIILFYCGLNTFNSNDDLPYSFMYRGEQRITSLGQVLEMQLSDYKIMNGRFIVHCVVQTLLIFNRVLFAIINPVFILGLTILGYLIIKKIMKIENKKSYIIPASVFILFMIIYSHKYLMYWIAGSVNYIWTLIVAVIIYYSYLKTKFNKCIIFNVVLFLIASLLHESLITYAVMFLIISIILDTIENKKLNIKKFLYFIPIIIGIKFLILSPGNATRTDMYPQWYNQSIMSRILESLPVVSYNCFNIKNIYNIIPLIYIISLFISFSTININKKIKIFFNSILVLSCVVGAILDNGYIYLGIIGLVTIMEIYYSIIKERKEVIPFLLSMYAVTFSMIITPLYDSTRPNIYLYFALILLLIIHIIDFTYNKEKINKIIRIVVYLTGILMLLFEIYELTYIGNIHQRRVKDITDANLKNSEVVYLEKVESPADIFQIEPNTIFYENYYSTKYYKQYYNIPKDMKIDMKE